MIKHNKNYTTAEYAMRSVLILLLIGWCCLSFGEKSLYFYKGYIFKHPFFENKCLYTTQNSLEVDAADNFFNLKPKAITYSGNDKTAVGAYLSGDSIYVFSTNLIPDACNNNRLVCTEPKYLATGPVIIDSTTAIYAVKSTATDAIKLCVSSSGGRVYIFSIEIASLSITARDSIILSSASGRAISSISGNSASFKIPDSQIWVTGSNGLLRSIRIGSVLKDSVFDITATENVRCFGSSLAGTASGSVFERNGNTFEKVYSVSGAIRTISASGLAGDGIVSVKTASGWAGIIQGSNVRYRECLVSANGSGAIYEVIDEQWGIDTIHGTNSNTQIASIIPASFMNYVNTSSKYSYKGDKNDTLRIKLTDFEKNYQPLSIVLNNGVTSKEIGTVNFSSGTQIANSDPSRVCIAGKMSLADSMIQIVLSNQVIVSASVLIAKDNVNCLQCMQTTDVVTNDTYWGYKNELTIRSSTQTLIIVNEKEAVTSLINAGYQNGPMIKIYKDGHLSSITLQAGDEIKSVNVFDLSGKRISSIIVAGNTIKLDKTGSGIVTVQVLLKNGKVISTRTVLTQR